MIKFLDNDSLWPAIIRLSNKANSSHVAIAYIGNGAANKLKLKEGDTLVTAINLASLQSGQVNPYEVEKFIRRGVKVYSKPSLHAKIYIFDDYVVACSANLSLSSEKSLIESGILTDDKKTTTHAKKFIKSCCEVLVNEAYLTWAKKHFVPSSGMSGPKASKLIDEPVYWIISTENSDLPDEVLEELAETDAPYERRLSNKRRFIIDYLAVSATGAIAKNAKEGDWLVEIYYSHGRLRVHAPKLILSKTILYSYHKPVIRIASPIVDLSFSWQSFKSHLGKHSIKSIGKITERKLAGKTLLAVQEFLNSQ